MCVVWTPPPLLSTFATYRHTKFNLCVECAQCPVPQSSANGNFLENDFWSPPPSYQFCTFCIIGHVAAAPSPLAAALGPLAYPSLSARPRNYPNRE